MKAKEYLQQVKKLDRMINNKLIEIEQWKNIATGTTASSEGERVQSSGSQQKMADAVTRYLDIQAEIDADIDRLVEIKKKVIKTIEKLPVIEYDILHRIYIQFKTLEEVADEEEKSYRWVTSIHGRALLNVQKIIDEENEIVIVPI